MIKRKNIYIKSSLLRQSVLSLLLKRKQMIKCSLKVVDNYFLTDVIDFQIPFPFARRRNQQKERKLEEELISEN